MGFKAVVLFLCGEVMVRDTTASRKQVGRYVISPLR